ncbi:MAG: SPOR domain-containing protein [Bacteroidales bacterium]
MQAPDTYLRELLYTYDCVTIPGLGGFIMHRQSARIDREKGRIHPPGRFPSFNSLLVHDDGLLVSTIARGQGISYQEAAVLVSQFASQCKTELLKSNRLVLNDIGEFTLNTKGAILFHPATSSNYNTESYGMGVLSLFPRTSDRQKARLATRPADRKPGKLHQKQPASVKWTLVLSLPIILFLLYGIFFPASVETFYADFSGLTHQLTFTKKIQEPVMIPDANEFRVTEDVTVTPEPSSADMEEFFIPADGPVQQMTEETAPVALLPDRFHIIGGCFENKANAVRFLEVLKSRGFNAREAGSNARGHLRISYGSFADRSSAMAYLEKIRKEENPAAWLLVF